jgi:hypothetical protein
MCSQYDQYNREERALCAHLFRLLHEGLIQYPKDSYLKCIIDKIDKPIVPEGVRNVWKCISNCEDELRKARIYCEVALIRDAVYKSKMTTSSKVEDYHKRKLAQKLLCSGGNKLWPEYEGLFSAKPDLVIAFPRLLLVFEAKLLMPFDNNQIARTEDVVDAWKALKIESESGQEKPLWSDLGVNDNAASVVLRLGRQSQEKISLTWEDVFQVMKDKHFPKEDRTWIAFEAAMKLLEGKK